MTAATTNTGLVWLVLRVPLVLALGTEQRLRSVYRRYRGVRNHAGLAATHATLLPDPRRARRQLAWGR
jgi:hypothetical protein